MTNLVERLLDHAALHETVLGQCGDEEQRQWAKDLREAASQIAALRNDADRMLKALRVAVIALAHASESDKTYKASYDHVSGTIANVEIRYDR